MTEHHSAGEGEPAQAARASTTLTDGTRVEVEIEGPNAEKRAHRALAAAAVAASEQTERPVTPGESMGITGESAPMQQLFHLLDRIVATSATVLITGENGTGKELVAKAIHQRSARGPSGAFVATNCSAFNDNLLESELFGHKRGSFTGAVGDKPGLFAIADGGTFFLDEVGDMSPALQVKLLRVLQDRAYTPVGSHEARRFAGRVVAATHRSLSELRASGKLRDDFYYRLCSDVISVPTLRQRFEEEPEELLALVRVIVPRLVGESSEALEGEVYEAILSGVGSDYAWPGNVRELEQCARRVLLTRRCGPDAGAALGRGADVAEDELDAKSVLARHCAALYERHGTFEQVARITGLDRRTVKKHVRAAHDAQSV